MVWKYSIHEYPILTLEHSNSSLTLIINLNIVSRTPKVLVTKSNTNINEWLILLSFCF